MVAPSVRAVNANSGTGITSASLDVTCPTALTDDLLVGVVMCGTPTTVTPPNGWTLWASFSPSTGGYVVVFHKPYVVGDTTFTWQRVATNHQWSATVASVSGAFLADPIEVGGAANQTNASPATVSASVPAGAGDLLMLQFVASNSGTSTFTPPAGTTEHYDAHVGTGYAMAVGSDAVTLGATSRLEDRQWAVTNVNNALLGVAILVRPVPDFGSTVYRGTLLYASNDETIDTGTGIDIRKLSGSAATPASNNQTVTATHTQDGAERTFDPETTGVSTEANASTFQGKGWAVRIANDMTPVDDARCNVLLPAQTLNAYARATLTKSGGTDLLGGTQTLTFRASVWRYNPSTDSAVLIGGGTKVQTWSTAPAPVGDAGTFKAVQIPVTVPDTEFLQGETLFLQLGAQMTSLSNPTLGTITYTVTLHVGGTDPTSGIILAQPMQTVCRTSSTTTGVGSMTRQPTSFYVSRTPVGVGAASKAALFWSGSRSPAGVGSVVRTLKWSGAARVVTGVGLVARSMKWLGVRTIVGAGSVSRSLLARLSKQAVGVGSIAASRLVEWFRYSMVTGVGTISASRRVIFVRYAIVTGKSAFDNYVKVPIRAMTGGTGGTTIIKKFFPNLFFDD